MDYAELLTILLKACLPVISAAREMMGKSRWAIPCKKSDMNAYFLVLWHTAIDGLTRGANEGQSSAPI